MIAGQLALTFPTCVLPGCTTLVDQDGDACRGCIDAFGTWLQRVDAEPMTAEQIADRDARTREVIRRRRTLAVTREPAAQVRKGRQLCWLCCEPKTCTRVAAGWECDTCRAVT